MRSILSAFVMTVVFAAFSGHAAIACSLSGSAFQFDEFATTRDQLPAVVRNKLAEIGAKSRAENCSLTVTAVAPQNANKEAFNIRFRQSYVAREALAWTSGNGPSRTAAMETIARFDVKAQFGRYAAGTIYIKVD